MPYDAIDDPSWNTRRYIPPYSTRPISDWSSDPNRGYVPALNTGPSSLRDDLAVTLDEIRKRYLGMGIGRDEYQGQTGADYWQWKNPAAYGGASGITWEPMQMDKTDNPWSMSGTGDMIPDPPPGVRSGARGENQNEIDAYWARVREAYPTVQGERGVRQEWPQPNPGYWGETKDKQRSTLENYRNLYAPETEWPGDAGSARFPQGQGGEKSTGYLAAPSGIPTIGGRPTGDWAKVPLIKRVSDLTQTANRFGTPYESWARILPIIQQILAWRERNTR